MSGLEGVTRLSKCRKGQKTQARQKGGHLSCNEMSLNLNFNSVVLPTPGGGTAWMISMVRGVQWGFAVPG